MENTSDSFIPRLLLFCLKSERSVCYSVPDNITHLQKFLLELGQGKKELRLMDAILE